MLLKIIATNIRAARKELGISQEELARIAKLHRTYIGALERGERNLTVSSLEKIAKALGKQPIDLLKRID